MKKIRRLTACRFESGPRHQMFFLKVPIQFGNLPLRKRARFFFRLVPTLQMRNHVAAVTPHATFAVAWVQRCQLRQAGKSG
ncbi:MAG: hypothetical protein RXR20_03575 [Paraburkholderia sp.]|uniref:hypothetical protein n=1 Tax=Burkholderiaceae TaxID=119060 RepID=UPI001485AE2A|nr:hypothetical protein [Burkholderia sp. 4M9327F10]